MTGQDHPADATTKDSPRPRYARRRQAFGGHVATTVDILQQKYLKKNSSALATMAQLRAAVTSPPGAAFGVLFETQVPDTYLPDRPGDEPTDTEQAKHTALTLYAVHQQSVYDKPMHLDGFGLGAAISLLDKQTESAQAVRRRFAALGTATTYDETVYHLRTLIRQLRDKKIGVDYGLLADDLVALRRPGGRERVTARWGRDFYRVIADDDPADKTSTEPTTAATAKE